MIKILVVDDSALMRRLLGEVFRAQPDMEVAFARDGLEAMRLLREVHPDVVTLDVHMPHMDGLELLDRLMVEQPCRVVMVSSLTAAGADVTLEALELGAIDFIAKPAGAISLGIDALGPALVEKVRAAAMARLRPTLRLQDRVRLRHQAGTIHVARRRNRATSLRLAGGAVRPAADRRPHDRLDGVVLVGASTGGPSALDALLSRLPAEFPWPILVAQHMPAAFTGPLARRLDRLCALEVIEVTRPTALRPGCAYVGKGDADIIVSVRPGGTVAGAAPPSAAHRWHPSVDRLVMTAMQHLDASRLIGVLMTGMGNDGAASMTRLRAAGGRTIAEAEDTAVVWGMPGELVKAGGAQVVAPLDDIAGQLLDWTT